MNNEYSEERSFTPPWSRIQSLQEMTMEAHIDFDDFIQSMRDRRGIEEMAERYKVSSSTIESLQEHFFRYGIASVIGGD